MFFGVHSLISRRNLCFENDSFLPAKGDLYCTRSAIGLRANVWKLELAHVCSQEDKQCALELNS